MTEVNNAGILWDKACGILVDQVSEAVWANTFKDVRALYLDENCLTLEVPSAFIRDRLDQRHRDLITSVLSDITGHALSLELRVADVPVESDPEDLDDALGELARESTGTWDLDDDRPLIGLPAAERPANINPKYTFESFVTGPSNRFAQAAALGVAETPGRAYNPLFVYGAAGLGKTHLLQAIAHYVAENYPTYRVRYISTETLMNEFIDAIRNNAQPEFKRRYREVQVLLVDDVQFMEGKEQLQEEFFHTFNTLYEANCQIVLSSDRSPDAVATLEDRLRSRFKMGLVTDIQPPDIETRMAILRKKATQSNVQLPSAVLEFIVTHITNNIRELEGALNRVTAWASLNSRDDVSVADAERILHDIIDDKPRRITPDLILAAVADKYGFSIAELKAKNRHRPLVTARQVGMYLFRELTELSYPQIAKVFGGRDHTTVIHAFEKISALMKERQTIYDDVQSLIQTIKTG
jgi:chromosomal replication initiator protein